MLTVLVPSGCCDKRREVPVLFTDYGPETPRVMPIAGRAHMVARTEAELAQHIRVHYPGSYRIESRPE
jgi:hypothetical protein